MEEHLFRNFKMCYPYFAKEVVNYELYEPFKLIVKLSDGEEVLYDDLDSSYEIVTTNVNKETWLLRFGRQLERKMRLKGIDRITLSEESGLSQAIIGKYIAGKSAPSLYNASKIAKVLNCSVEDLLHFPK